MKLFILRFISCITTFFPFAITLPVKHNHLSITAEEIKLTYPLYRFEMYCAFGLILWKTVQIISTLQNRNFLSIQHILFILVCFCRRIFEIVCFHDLIKNMECKYFDENKFNCKQFSGINKQFS